MFENSNIQRFPRGHEMYPDGAVVVTEYGEIDPETNEAKQTVYTVEEWEALLNSLPSPV